MGSRLTIPPEELARLCRAYRVQRLSLFGSELKGSAGPGSDVDLLVEFEPGVAVTLLDLARFELDLSERLGGRPVDLRTPRDLSRHFRDDVLRSAEPLYVAG